MNPAEFLLDLVNVDFAPDQDTAQQELQAIHASWKVSPQAGSLTSEIDGLAQKHEAVATSLEALPWRGKMLLPLTLLYRSFIKSYRDVVAYGVRVAMYTGG